MAILSAPEGGIFLGSTLEHPASVSACDRWSAIGKRKFVQVPHNDKTRTVTASDYEPYVTQDTRIATILHTSPVTGMSVDIISNSRLIRGISTECYIIVDGIQHAAHGSFNLDIYGIDGYVISP